MIHVDIDPAEIGKIRTPDVPIVGDVKKVLQKILEELEATGAANEEQERHGARGLVGAD